MTDTVDLKINGVDETIKSLYAFSDKLGDRVTRLALRSGANFMLKPIRAAAPKKTGRLRRAIKVKNSRKFRPRLNGKIGVYITISKGKNRRDPKGAYYGAFQEKGWQFKGPSGRKVAGKKFVENGFNQYKRQSLELIIRNIETGGQRLAREIKSR